MSGSGWIQLGLLAALAVGLAWPLGLYIARVYGGGPAPLDRVFLPVERVVYRALGIDPSREQRWTAYALSVLAFSTVSFLGLYLLQRVQGSLPLNPTDVGAVPPALAFNTAISFVTNTNWQNYAGESTMSHLTQMAGLTVQNFVSAAVGVAVAIALVRGLMRTRGESLGSFWVDLTRAVTRILLPIALVLALALVALGSIQTLSGPAEVTTLEGAKQSIALAPIASQEAIKELGTNGGGPFNANSAHPFENPNGITNLLQMLAILVIPFALTFTFGRLVGDRRQGLAVLGAMLFLWAGSAFVAVHYEEAGNPRLQALGAQGSNMEGKETRFGAATSGIYAATTTGTSTGAVISSHDSFTPLGGAAPMVNMMLGEVSPGGVGAGLYGMLVFAILAVFIAGLMVGRTPEYLGKRIGATEMKLVSLAILTVPALILVFSGIAVLLPTVLDVSIYNPGPHGLSEVVYAYASASNNNGSAFGGLTGNTDWFNTTLGLAMLFGRFVTIALVLALAGSLVRKQRVPATSGTFPTGSGLFTGLLVGTVLLVAGLTFIPVLALGPILEHLSL